MVTYEFPLGEKIRTWSRFERLFQQFSGVLNCALSPTDSFATPPSLSLSTPKSPSNHWEIFAFHTLFELIEMAERGDMRGELLLELDRFSQFLQTLLGSPELDMEAWEKLTKDIGVVMMELRATSGRASHVLLANPWISNLRGRMGMPGGYSEFDLPSLHWWRHQSFDRMQSDLRNFKQLFQPIENGIALILRNIRETAEVEYFSLTTGAMMLPNTRGVVLIRIHLPDDCPYFPSVTANRFQINIVMNEFVKGSWETKLSNDSSTVSIQQCVMPSVAQSS